MNKSINMLISKASSTGSTCSVYLEGTTKGVYRLTVASPCQTLRATSVENHVLIAQPINFKQVMAVISTLIITQVIKHETELEIVKSILVISN